MWRNNVSFHFYFSGFPHAYRPLISFYKAGTTGKLRRTHCTLIYLCICFDIYLLLSSLAEAWLLGLNVSRITTNGFFCCLKKILRNIDPPLKVLIFLAILAFFFFFFLLYWFQWAVCMWTWNECSAQLFSKSKSKIFNFVAFSAFFVQR